MKLVARQRWMILGGLLTATLAAAAWMRDSADNAVPEVVTVAQSELGRASSPSRSPSRHEPPQVNLEKLKARSLSETARDPFALPAPRVRQKPAPPPPPPPVAATVAPPPPPGPPPLPFTYLGKLLSKDDQAVFLTQGERNLVVREGDTIDSLYRVERIAESAITLVYIPLGQEQTIVIGEPH